MTARVAQRPLPGRPDPGALALGAGAAAVGAGAAVTLGPAALGVPVVLLICLALVREPLALLTLYAYVGLFKEQAVLGALPFDATVALGLLLTGVCFARWSTGRGHAIPLGFASPLVIIGAFGSAVSSCSSRSQPAAMREDSSACSAVSKKPTDVTTSSPESTRE